MKDQAYFSPCVLISFYQMVGICNLSTYILLFTEIALLMLIKPNNVVINSREVLIKMFVLLDVQEREQQVERQRERWEKRHHRRRQRSISREKWVETLVVADPKMVEYYGKDGVESYVLAVMNIVSRSYFSSLGIFLVSRWILDFFFI